MPALASALINQCVNGYAVDRLFDELEEITTSGSIPGLPMPMGVVNDPRYFDEDEYQKALDRYRRERQRLINEEQVDPTDKAWVLGIKKSWKKVLNELLKSRDYQHLLFNVDNVKTFLKTLQQDLYFNRGFFSGHVDPDMHANLNKDQKKYISFRVDVQSADAILKIKDKLETFVTNMQHTAVHIYPDQYKALGLSQYTYEMAAKNIEQFRENHPELVKNPQHWWQISLSETSAYFIKEIDTLFNKGIIKAVIKYLETMHFPQESVKRVTEFKIGQVTCIMDQPKNYRIFSADQAKTYPAYDRFDATIPLVRKAYEFLKIKKLDKKIWYGRMIFYGNKGKTISAGAYKGHGVAGTYNAQHDTVDIYLNSMYLDDLPEVIIHELAHRYYFKFLTSAERLKFTDQFGAHAEDPVSTYGGTNEREDFAEVFTHYVMNYDLNRGKLERLKSFFAGRNIRENIVEDFKEFCTRRGVDMEDLRAWNDAFKLWFTTNVL